MARKWELTPFTSKPIKTGLKVLSTSLVISCLSSQVFAAGFQIQEQNASQLGLAYSGTAAIAEDASTGFWNAAGLSRIKNSQVVGGVVGIFGTFDYTSSAAYAAALQPATGTSDDAAEPAVVPSFHVATRFNDKWVLGFSINNPYGLTTEYDSDSVARYVATKSKLETWNFGVHLAYQVLSCMSFGFGLDGMYGKAQLHANVYDGPNFPDGFQHNSLEGWGLGFHAGVLWQVLPSTRLGLAFRSKVNLHAEGDSESVGGVRALGLPNQVYNIREVQTMVNVPETLIFSFYHDFNEMFALTGDVHWTNWSRTEVLSLRYHPGLQTAAGIGIDTDTFIRFKDTIRAALGLIYNYDDQWSFRVGAAFDETPTTDADRIARLPDEDRWWLAIGVAYTLNDKWRFDLGYSHIFFKDATVVDNGPTSITGVPMTGGANFSAKFDSNANLLGVQFRYDFV